MQASMDFCMTIRTDQNAFVELSTNPVPRPCVAPGAYAEILVAVVMKGEGIQTAVVAA